MHAHIRVLFEYDQNRYLSVKLLWLKDSFFGKVGTPSEILPIKLNVFLPQLGDACYRGYLDWLIFFDDSKDAGEFQGNYIFCNRLP